jgi:hypothetical protein
MSGTGRGYMVGTCRGLYSVYMSWFIKQVQVVVFQAGAGRGLYGGYRSCLYSVCMP